LNTLVQQCQTVPTRHNDQLHNQWTLCALTADILHLYSEIQVTSKPLFDENEQTPVTETKIFPAAKLTGSEAGACNLKLCTKSSTIPYTLLLFLPSYLPPFFTLIALLRLPIHSSPLLFHPNLSFESFPSFILTFSFQSPFPLRYSHRKHCELSSSARKAQCSMHYSAKMTPFLATLPTISVVCILLQISFLVYSMISLLYLSINCRQRLLSTDFY